MTENSPLYILITGASRGIGYEAAVALCAQGHHVLAVSRNLEGLRQLEQRVHLDNSRAQLTLFPFDITDDQLEETLLPRLRQSVPRLDVLINNAGHLLRKPFESISPEEWHAVYKTNVYAPFRMTQLAVPLMKDSASPHIINIGSMGGFQGSARFPGLTAYSSSKSALAGLSEVLAEELKEKGIKVNCLALGAAQTAMLGEAFPGYQAPLTAAEMGGFLAWFAQNGQKFFNGKVLPVSVSTP